jgi:hypothetical protein
MLKTYFISILRRSLTGAVTVADGTQVLLIPVVGLTLWLRGITMTDSAATDALAYIGILAITVFALRVLTASYFMWKEEREKAEAARVEKDNALEKLRNSPGVMDRTDKLHKLILRMRYQMFDTDHEAENDVYHETMSVLSVGLAVNNNSELTQAVTKFREALNTFHRKYYSGYLSSPGARPMDEWPEVEELDTHFKTVDRICSEKIAKCLGYNSITQ